MRNDGNCCWEFFERKYGRGQNGVIAIGEVLEKLTFKLSEFKKYNCNNSTEQTSANKNELVGKKSL